MLKLCYPNFVMNILHVLCYLSQALEGIKEQWNSLSAVKLHIVG